MHHLETNIPQNIFYLAMKSELLLRMAHSTLCLGDLITKELLKRMKQQGSKHNVTNSSLRKILFMSRVIPTVLYLMPGPPKRFLRR